MKAPHSLKQMDRGGFMAWLEGRGATLQEPTNQYEVVRYKMWTEQDEKRPSTHIVYRRGNDTLTYAGDTRAHYAAFQREKRKPS